MTSLGEPARNDSKGCGGVMRMAPVGLFAWHFRNEQSPQYAFNLGTELAALTHGHITGQLTGGVFAVLIQALTDGATLPDALTTAKACLRLEPGHEETLRAIESGRGTRHEGVYLTSMRSSGSARAGLLRKRWLSPSTARWLPAISNTALSWR